MCVPQKDQSFQKHWWTFLFVFHFKFKFNWNDDDDSDDDHVSHANHFITKYLRFEQSVKEIPFQLTRTASTFQFNFWDEPNRIESKTRDYMRNGEQIRMSLTGSFKLCFVNLNGSNWYIMMMCLFCRDSELDQTASGQITFVFKLSFVCVDQKSIYKMVFTIADFFELWIAWRCIRDGLIWLFNAE